MRGGRGWTNYPNATGLGLDPRLIKIWRHGRNGDRERARVTYGDEVQAVAFSPDSQYLATASDDKTARLWSTALGDMFRQLCAGHGRNLSHSEWRRYLGDLPWQPTCESWPTPED